MIGVTAAASAGDKRVRRSCTDERAAVIGLAGARRDDPDRSSGFLDERTAYDRPSAAASLKRRVAEGPDRSRRERSWGATSGG